MRKPSNINHNNNKEYCFVNYLIQGNSIKTFRNTWLDSLRYFWGNLASIQDKEAMHTLNNQTSQVLVS